MGYLSQVKAAGRQYIYLTEYCGNQEFTSKTEKHVYSFGQARIALLKMKRWKRRYENEFPIELINLGYGIDDLSKWINTLESKRTSNGKQFNGSTQKRAIY